MSRCPSCHNQLPQDALFCGFCGAPLATRAAQERTAATPADPFGPTLLSKQVHRASKPAGASAFDPQPPWMPAAFLLSAAAAAAVPSSRIATPVPEPWPFLPSEILLTLPGSKLLRLLTLVAGVAFLAIFLTPLLWGATQTTSLRWLLGEPLNGLPFIRRSFPLAAGSLLLLVGLLPVPHRLRALLATSIGVLALALLATAADWRSALLLGALILLTTGLLQKYSFPDRRSAAALILLGASGILTALLLPHAGQLPLITTLDQLAGGSLALQFYKSLPLFLLPLALFSALTAFSSCPSRWMVAGAILALLYLPAHTLLELLLGRGLGQAAPALAAQLSLVVSIQLGLLLASVGLFQLVSPRGSGYRSPETSISYK